MILLFFWFYTFMLVPIYPCTLFPTFIFLFRLGIFNTCRNKVAKKRMGIDGP